MSEYNVRAEAEALVQAVITLWRPHPADVKQADDAAEAALLRARGDMRQRVETFRLYTAHHARGAGKLVGPLDPRALCAVQERAIRQLDEYLSGEDPFLAALVENAAEQERAALKEQP